MLSQAKNGKSDNGQHRISAQTGETDPLRHEVPRKVLLRFGGYMKTRSFLVKTLGALSFSAASCRENSWRQSIPVNHGRSNNHRSLRLGGVVQSVTGEFVPFADEDEISLAGGLAE